MFAGLEGNAAFQMVRRLTRLPPREKKKIVISQLLPILTYGAELHSTPSQRGMGYAAEWNRFVTGAWRGSSRERVADIVGIAELQEAMRRKIRWGASVYDRGVKELWEVAEKILREHLEEEFMLRWVEGKGEKIQELEILESAEVAVAGTFTDGSRLEGRAAAATITRAEYLGRYATVMDAEMLAIAMGWELGDTVITDSQAAIGRVKNLQTEPPKGWIEERVTAAAKGRKKKLAWVKGHSGVMGNELADLKAKREAWEGVRRGEKNIATAARIKHELRVTWRLKQVQEWDREALKGHTYIYTDRGPFKAWLHQIGREVSPICPYGEAIQNAAHVLKCKLVEGGEKRSAEDMEFCRAVYKFLWEGGAG